MKRFFVSEPLRVGARLRLSAEESRHATRVMRLELGSVLLLADGKGLEAEATLLEADREGALVEVGAVRELPARAYRVELLQGILKGPRMDWLVEKATELGVDAVHAVETRFSVAGDRVDRWARVAQAAVKQSGSPRAPILPEVAPLKQALARFPAGYHGFLLQPGAALGLAQAVRAGLPEGRGTVVLAIGPEGGFAPDEESNLLAQGFRACALAPQILRGETAGLVAAAVALHTLEFDASARPVQGGNFGLPPAPF